VTINRGTIVATLRRWKQRPDFRDELLNTDQADSDSDGVGDACEK